MFKAGDKVVRTGQCTMDVVQGEKYTVREVDYFDNSYGDIYIVGSDALYCAGLFELADEEFNLKTTPWHIDTKGKDSKAIQQWLFDNGMVWRGVFGETFIDHYRYITNVDCGEIQPHMVHCFCPELITQEIKLDVELPLKVNSVEFPSARKQSRKNELFEIIRKAQDKLNSLN